MNVERATVTATSPLTVQLFTSATAVPAKRITGTTYTPAVNDVVAVTVFRDGAVLVLATFT